MDNRERYSDSEEAIRIALQGLQSGIWTAMPGVIQTYDSAALTVTVQPAIQGTRMNQDGTVDHIDLPQLLDVPVVFPRGGQASMTFPVAVGDECLVVFASRCIDAWWQAGGVKNVQMEPRMHDLSDGFALLGPFSQTQKISDVSTSAVEIRSNDGSTVISLDPSGQVVHVAALGGMVVDADVEINGTANVSGALTADSATVTKAVSAATLTVSGAATLGSVTTSGAISGGSVSAGSAALTGALTAGSVALTGALTADTATVAGLTVSNPVNIALGSGWLNWTPTITCSASMTATSISITDAQYIRVGPICHMKAVVSMTLGGTADQTVFASIPIPIVGNLSALSTNIITGSGNPWKPGFSYVLNGQNKVVIQNPYAATWPLGFMEFMFSGSYRVA